MPGWTARTSPRTGPSSVGARQYCGQLDKRANCQAVVFAACLGRGAAALVDRRLCLFQAWVSGADHAARRWRTGVPPDIPFRTKPQLVLDMLAGLRWPIEQCFRDGRQLFGQGDYEGRNWQGWHRHATLVMPPPSSSFTSSWCGRCRGSKKQPGLTVPRTCLLVAAALPRTASPTAPSPLWATAGRATRSPPIPTPGVAGRNSHPDLSLQCSSHNLQVHHCVTRQRAFLTGDDANQSL